MLDYKVLIFQVTLKSIFEFLYNTYFDQKLGNMQYPHNHIIMYTIGKDKHYEYY